jgi:hypothetical protein
MKVLIHFDPPIDKVNVYVYSDDRRHVAHFIHPWHIEWIEWIEGEVPKPTIVLNRDMWEAIMKEAVGAFPSDDAIKDARQMRDRLLKMIESEWQARVEGK